MRPGASIQEMRAWVAANGADPLVETVWARIALIEGEDQRARFEREKAEARADAERRKAQSEKSRRLARERGLRDPVRERRRFAVLTGSVAAVALLAAVAVVYLTDAAGRDRVLRDDVTTPAQVRAIRSPTTAGIRSPAPRGRNSNGSTRTPGLRRARTAASAPSKPMWPTRKIHRRAIFSRRRTRCWARRGKCTRSRACLRGCGCMMGRRAAPRTLRPSAPSRCSRYRRNMPVSADIDDALMQKLAEDLEWWTHPRLEELHATSVAPPSEADYVRLAQSLGVDAATIRALVEVETGSRAPSPSRRDGRMIITFEPSQFARLTQRRLRRDASSALREERVLSHPEGALGDARPGLRARPQRGAEGNDSGRLQILGMHHERAGCKTVGEFVRVMRSPRQTSWRPDCSGSSAPPNCGCAAAPRLGCIRSPGITAAITGSRARMKN